MLLAYRWSERDGYARLDDLASHQLDLYVAALESELGKYAYLPSLLEVDRDFDALLESPDRPTLREEVSRKLASFNVRAGAMAIFLVGRDGVVVAASDWYRPDTMVGRKLASRPYFVDALQGEQGRYFAAAPSRFVSEYYFTQPFRRDDRVIGVVGVKISLDPIEATWVESAYRSDSERLLVIDENNVVILSSVPAWKYKATVAVSPTERGELEASGKYPQGSL